VKIERDRAIFSSWENPLAYERIRKDVGGGQTAVKLQPIFRRGEGDGIQRGINSKKSIENTQFLRISQKRIRKCLGGFGN
ncbi:MAG: hypothetical protein J6Q54_00765, partial [Oscillospiraceae bacterium]|nr:hypothetical protein [Oscillospiraceae bacterium]